MYGMLQPQHEGSDLHNLFSTQDKTFHAQLKRELGNLYSERGVLVAEPAVDKTIGILVDRLESLSKDGPASVDISAWLHWWAFDTIVEVNLSTQLGFLAKGEDVNHLCAGSHQAMRYFGLVRICTSIGLSHADFRGDGTSAINRKAVLNHHEAFQR